jgi:hypothetical protein
MSERQQMLWLFVLAAPIACVAWTVTHEEVFREIREFCQAKSEQCRRLYQRKFFYLFTCEYCFSHYVAAAVVLGTGYRLLIPDWRGAVLAWFTLVWLANIYMSLFGRLRLDIKRERVEIKAEEIKAEELEVERDESGEIVVPPVQTPNLPAIPLNQRARRSASATRPPARPAHRA